MDLCKAFSGEKPLENIWADSDFTVSYSSLSSPSVCQRRRTSVHHLHLPPVSYTHLDVYKRQVQDFVALLYEWLNKVLLQVLEQGRDGCRVDEHLSTLLAETIL